MSMSDPLLMTIRMLTSVIDAADPFSRGRSLRIARYCLRVAREIGVPESDRPAIECAALLHDIGRTTILQDVTLQPRALDAGERALVQTHPGIGRDMLAGIPGLEAAAEIVWAHHERPDGKGYPRGLAGEHIPMGANLIMVAAAYDAMVEERPYRRGLTAEAACAELQRCAGTQFDARVVAAFVRLHTCGQLWEEFTADERELYLRRSEAEAA